MLAGAAIAVVATVAGIATTGVSLAYFFQPTGVLIVVGGTLGVTLVATPRTALAHSARRVMDLFWTPHLNRQELIEEIVSYTRLIRLRGRTPLSRWRAASAIPFSPNLFCSPWTSTNVANCSRLWKTRYV
jgi:flagellar motor component MotA